MYSCRPAVTGHSKGGLVWKRATKLCTLEYLCCVNIFKQINYKKICLIIVYIPRSRNIVSPTRAKGVQTTRLSLIRVIVASTKAVVELCCVCTRVSLRSIVLIRPVRMTGSVSTVPLRFAKMLAPSLHQYTY